MISEKLRQTTLKMTNFFSKKNVTIRQITRSQPPFSEVEQQYFQQNQQNYKNQQKTITVII